MATDEDMVDLLPYAGSLSAQERDLARAALVTRRFDAGQLVFGGTADCLGQVVVLEGEVRAYLLSEEGREVTLFSLGAGDPCVLSASTRPPSSGGTA